MMFGVKANGGSNPSTTAPTKTRRDSSRRVFACPDCFGVVMAGALAGASVGALVGVCAAVFAVFYRVCATSGALPVLADSGGG